MNVTFRPAVERLDARDLPASGIFSDILVTSVVAPHPTAPAVVVESGHEANRKQTRQTSIVVEL